MLFILFMIFISFSVKRIKWIRFSSIIITGIFIVCGSIVSILIQRNLLKKGRRDIDVPFHESVIGMRIFMLLFIMLIFFAIIGKFHVVKIVKILLIVNK